MALRLWRESRSLGKGLGPSWVGWGQGGIRTKGATLWVKTQRGKYADSTSFLQALLLKMALDQVGAVLSRVLGWHRDGGASSSSAVACLSSRLRSRFETPEAR